MTTKSAATRLVPRALLALLMVGALPSVSFGLAEFNTFFGLPDGLANGVVRIREATANGNFAGTGTVIDIRPDGMGGEYLCILTADHVIHNPINGALATSLSVGFRFDQAFPLTVTNVMASSRSDSPVDLAVFAVDVPMGTTIPSILPATVIAANTAAGNQIVQAGYGDQATPGTGPPAAAGQDRYLVTPGFGTYLTGTNTITGTTANVVGAPIFNGSPNNYTFDSLDGTFAFTKNGGGMITSGTSYILSGDSGGPTFESNGMGGLGLVGVHSFSDQHTIPGPPLQEFNIPGDQWHDVNANQYAAFIAQACAAVPEPASVGLMALGAGGFGLLLRRRRA